MNRWHMRPKRFVGAITFGEMRAHVNFRVEVLATGVAKLLFESIPRDASTDFLIAAFHDQGSEMRFFDFILTGEARDGSTFHSASAHIQSLVGIFSNLPSPSMKLSVFCLECEISLLAQSNESRSMKAFLIGFDIAQPIFATCPLGTVELRGPETLKPTEKNRLTGELVLSQQGPDAKSETWTSSALALLTHVQSIMSFARGRRLGVPITQTDHCGRVEMMIRAQIPQVENGVGVFSAFDYGAIFRQAVASHFFEPGRAKNIAVAVAWFGMPSSYREAKLISAMTVLENLLTENLHQSMLTSRTKSQSKQLRHAILDVVQIKLEDFGLTPEAIQVELKFLMPKLEDLNRKTLLEKISMLAKNWGVPLDDLVEHDLAKAKQARDWIVHQGRCRKEESADDVMRHVRLIRELVVRFILTALEFEGMYVSPMTGKGAYHRIVLRPELS